MKTALALALLCASSLAAQSKIDPVVDQVNDRRGGGSFSQLSITLKLPNIKTGDVAASRVLVKFAVDNLGMSLLDSSAGEPELEPNPRAVYGDDKGSPATVSVNLKNPARKATAVKQVSGDIELYMPSKDPNSVAEFPKFTSMSGKPLPHKALKANGIEIASVSASQAAAANLQIDEGDQVLKIKDPNKRIHEISYVDAGGEEKRVSVSDREGYTVLSTWGDKPQPDWKLRVSLKTSKNIVRYPFAISNVALP